MVAIKTHTTEAIRMAKSGGSEEARRLMGQAVHAKTRELQPRVLELKLELETELDLAKRFEEQYVTLDQNLSMHRNELRQAREKAKAKLDQEAKLRKSCNGQYVLQKRRVYESWRTFSTPNDQRRAFFLKAEEINQEPTKEALSLYRNTAKKLNQNLEIVQQSHLVEATHEKLNDITRLLQNTQGLVHNTQGLVLSLAQKGIKLDPATPQSRIADVLQAQKIVVASECARATEKLNKTVAVYEREWGQLL